jgi:hypothetical protein
MRDKRTWIIYEIDHDGEFSNLWLGIGALTRSAPCATTQAAHPWSRPCLCFVINHYAMKVYGEVDV